MRPSFNAFIEAIKSNKIPVILIFFFNTIQAICENSLIIFTFYLLTFVQNGEINKSEIFLEEVALDAVNLIEANPNKEDNPELHRLFMAYMYLYTLALDKGLVRELNNTIHNIKIH